MQAGADTCGSPSSEPPRRGAIASIAQLSASVTVVRSEDSDSDEALMAAYCQGDEAAFERLYRRHRNGLYRYLLRQCAVASVAEELFQDVWLGVIRARRQYVAEARFTTYIYRVAHNRLVDHYRRSVHRPSAPRLEEDGDPADDIPAEADAQPEVRFEAAEQIERFRALLAALPEAQREAFVLHVEAGLTVAEIATVTGVHAETAKSRLRYAVARLRRGMLELR